MTLLSCTNLSLPLVTAVLAISLSRPAHSVADEPSLAKLVPANVGFFVEARDASPLLESLSEPQIWAMLADIAGQPAEPADVTRWIARIRRTIRMEPAEAIRVLLSRQVAFVGEGPGRSPDAVALCRPTGEISVSNLLQRWKAQPMTSPPGAELYRLTDDVAVAVLGDVLAFGDPRLADGMFQAVARLRANAPAGNLAEDPAFAGLLGRMQPGAQALLFARLSRQAPVAATQPAGTESAPAPTSSATQPRGAAGALLLGRNLMLTLHRSGSSLRIALASDAPPAARPARADAVPLTSLLPGATIGSWEGRVDIERAARALRSLPPRNVLRVAMNLVEQTDAIDRLLGALSGEFCLAIGTVDPAGRPEGSPPVPAVALLARTRDDLSAAEHFNTVVESVVTVHDFLSLANGVPPLPRSREVTINSAPAVLLDLSRALEPLDDGTLRELHLCWTVQDGLLILASHRDWMRQVLGALHGETPRFADAVGLASDAAVTEFDNLVAAQSERVCTVGEQWLEHLRRRWPAALQEDWWRQRQPGGGEVVLGIDVTPEADSKRLRVEVVRNTGVSRGFLRAGDWIVGTERKRFATSQPVDEIRAAIRNRPHARWVELLVERERVLFVIRIPVPFVNPVQALRQAIAVGRHTERIVYYDRSNDPAGPAGVLLVQLREAEPPRSVVPEAVGATQPSEPPGS